MFVIAADHIVRRESDEHIDEQLAALDALGGGHLTLPATRTAGDAIQAATEHPGTAVSVVLLLSRTGRWNIGLGVGDVGLPLPESSRELAGSAVDLARAALERSRKRPSRFAIDVAAGRLPDGELLEPLIDLVLHLRARRSAQGWQVHDLLRTGMTQAEAALRLGITPQAVSLRTQSAQLRTEFSAETAIARLLDAAGSPD